MLPPPGYEPAGCFSDNSESNVRSLRAGLSRSAAGDSGNSFELSANLTICFLQIYVNSITTMTFACL